MFGPKFWDYFKETTPELFNMEVLVGGYPLVLSDFDCINALIVHNNILNGQQGKVAIFRPEGSLSEVYMLIMAGLAYYKDAAIRNDKLSEHDFTPGILVSYKGEIYRYVGPETADD